MNLNPEVSAKIEAIDLTKAKERLQSQNYHWKWSATKTNEIERKYKNFLRLIAMGMTAVPTLDVDELWHLHILDTQSYAEDCQRVFGKFIHHMPYITEGARNDAWKNTCQMYESYFGEKYSTPKKKEGEL